jgi:hypothetical protein
VSDGQSAAEPVHDSATSQSPAEGRHVVEDGWKFWTQVALEPVPPEHVS